jgi:peptide deformylase
MPRMSLEIVTYPAAVLSRPARRIERKDGLDLHQLFAEMSEAMDKNHGVGLAAPQVGLGIRFLVAHNLETKETRPFVNPQILNSSHDMEIRSEGCLSFPELYGDVERSKSIVVRYQDLDFQQHEETVAGHFARVLQHEIDHLNGVLILDRALDGLYQYEEDEEQEGAPEDEDEEGAETTPDDGDLDPGVELDEAMSEPVTRPGTDQW